MILAIVALVLMTSYARAASAPSYQFAPSGHDGGGGQSAIAADPFTAGRIISGGDIWGFVRSLDFGRDFVSINVPESGNIFYEERNTKVAAVKFSTITPNRVYAGVGRMGTGGGFVVSENGGDTWVMRSTKPQFAGSNTDAPLLAQGHPRSVGNLIALDASSGSNEIIYVGTYKQGLMRSSDQGKNWDTITFPGTATPYIRGIAMSDTDPSTIYVALWDMDGDTDKESVYVVNNAPTATQAAVLAAPFSKAEELVVCHGVLYIAAHNSGVYTYTSADGFKPSYTDAGASLFYSIDGYWDDATQKAIVYAGTSTAKNVAGSSYLNYSVIRTKDSGASWKCLTADESKLHKNMKMGDENGDIWWHSVNDASAILGGNSFVACQTLVDPLDHKRVYVCGRAGLWRTDDALTTDNPSWYPCMRHVNATVDNAVLADPNNVNRVYLTDYDWTFLYSTDKASHMTQKAMSLGGGEEWGMAVDSTTNPGSPSAVYLGRGNALGYNANPPSSAWQNTNLPATGNVMGCAVKKTAEGTVVLAAVEGSGIWRKVGAGTSGNWGSAPVYNANNVMKTSNTKQVVFSWGAGASQLVYLHDRNQGVFRSRDDGKTWEKITPPSGSTWLVSGRNASYSGTVTIDPTNESNCYITGTDGVFFSSNAADPTPTFTKISITGMGTATPGWAVYDDEGSIYINCCITASAPPKLFFKPAGGSTWTNIATDSNFLSQCTVPRQMSVGPGPDHMIYLAGGFSGICVGSKQTSAETGAVKVTIAPPEAVTAGAQWRLTGSSTWSNSDAIVSGIPVGAANVEFSAIPGWLKPFNQPITIAAGATTTLTGTYAQSAAQWWMGYR